MVTMAMRRFFIAASLVAGSLVVAGSLGGACANSDAAIRDFVAPDFHRIDDTHLQDAMWRLGNGVQNLSDLFDPAAGLTDADREKNVIEVLGTMADAANTVNKPGQKKAHSNVAMNIDKLIGDIEAARTAAVNHDLAPAQALPMTCLACHQGQGGGEQKKE